MHLPPHPSVLGRSLYFTNERCWSSLRFLSLALGGNQSGAASCKPLRHRPCSKGCLFGCLFLQTGFVGNRFALSRPRHGARSVASGFSQAASASTLFEELRGPNLFFLQTGSVRNLFASSKFCFGGPLNRDQFFANPFGLSFLRKAARSEH